MSLMIHLTLLGILIVVPLVYYRDLPEYRWVSQEQVLTTVSVYPPPKPKRFAPKRELQVVKLDPAQFVTPLDVPETISVPVDDILGLPSLSGILWGRWVGYGVPGGILWVPPEFEFVIFDDFGVKLPGVEPPEPMPQPTTKKPIRVGGNLQASRLIHRVKPEYPELARRARVSGMVILQVIVSEDGVVEEVTIVRGHPLLNEAALQAIRQWRYSPYYLNGEPIPVTATVTVNFVLRWDRVGQLRQKDPIAESSPSGAIKQTVHPINS